MESDNYNPVIGFDGEAHDTLIRLSQMIRGFGVTLVLEDGSEVEAVFSEVVYDEESDRNLVEFLRAENGEYPALGHSSNPPLERAFVRRIQVA